LLFLCISASPIAIQAEQTAPATNVKKGPDWIISEINPLQKTATRGQEALFDIQLTNLTRSRYQRVEVSLIPAVSGRQGLFEIKPFHVQNIKPFILLLESRDVHVIS
jgi:hypothetical protein